MSNIYILTVYILVSWFYSNHDNFKVFVIHDPSLPMRAYQERLNELLRILTPTFNCLPYTK